MEEKRAADEERARGEARLREFRAFQEERERKMNAGHQFTGWEPAEPISDASRAEIVELEGFEAGTPMVRGQISQRIAELSGRIVPTCECGWRGHPEDWEPEQFRSNEQHSTHMHHVHLNRIQSEHNAAMAAAALSQAAAAWSGDHGVSEWLAARAQHIKTVGEYDGVTWPT